MPTLIESTVTLTFQRWVKNHLLREKEAKALAEEDYELAEQLSSQLDELGVKPEQDIVSIALPKVG